MSTNYARSLPRDEGGSPMQGLSTPIRPFARYGKHSATASSVITVTNDTTLLEISAASGTVAMRFVATGDTEASVVAIGAGANFDHIIHQNETERFAIPIETIGTSSIVGSNIKNGLYRRYAIIAAGANASVYGTEF